MKYIFPLSQCERSVACHGCEKRFEREPATHFDDPDDDIEPLYVYNRDYYKCKKEIGGIKRGQTYYEVHYMYEHDEYMVNSQTHVVPSDHLVFIEQYQTRDEAVASTGCYTCGGVPFIIYEMKDESHSVIEAHYWGKGEYYHSACS